MNYKLKKVLLFIGYEKIERALKLKSPEFELTEMERFFVTIWKQKVYEKETEIYHKEVEKLNNYYLVDRKNDLILKMLTDFHTAKIVIIQLKGSNSIIQTGRLDKTTMDRLVKSYFNRLALSCDDIDKEIDEKLHMNLKELALQHKEDEIPTYYLGNGNDEEKKLLFS